MKITFNTAAKERKTDFPAESFHITTCDFGRTIVSNFYELEQGEKLHGDVKQFFRLSPLVVPTYGNAHVVTRAFCVPFRVVTPNWEAFWEDTADESLKKVQPYVTNDQLIKIFTNQMFSAGLSTAGDNGSYDFCLYENGTTQYYLLTEKGRWLYQILLGLGFSINWSMQDTTKLELRPVLAFMRCCYDWLYPSRWVMNLGIGGIFTHDSWDEGDIQIIFQALLDLLFVPYMQDNFNSAWVTFNSPSGNLESDIAGQSAYNPANGMHQVAYGTSSIGIKNAGSENTLTAYGLRLMQAFSDIITRDNLAGSRFLERVKAAKGYVTQEQKHSYSEFLKSFGHSINLMDVTATTGNENQLLGEQAAKGYVNGDDKFVFEAKEHCYIIFITQVMPSIGYYQGRKPWTIYKDSRFKYYREELDSVGFEPLRNDQLFAEFLHTNGVWSEYIANGGKPDGIFGFQPRYNEYKHGYDFMTGDFRLRSRAIGAPSYHTMRMLPQPRANTPLANNADFLRVDDQYKRIFAVDPTNPAGAKYDHFIGYFSFNLKKSSHKLSVSESIPMFNKSGREVTTSYEGTQL